MRGRNIKEPNPKGPKHTIPRLSQGLGCTLLDSQSGAEFRENRPLHTAIVSSCEWVLS